MKVSMVQIGEAAGVCTATVSNALNHKPGVNPETAAHIFRVARELGYFSGKPLSCVRFLYLKKNGLTLRDTPFFAALLQGVEQACRAQEIDVLFSSVDPVDGIPQCARLEDVSQGVILLATAASEEEIGWFDHFHGPLLILDHCPRHPAHSAVLIDNEGGAFQAVEHLTGQGHRRIGYLRCAPRFQNFIERETGFRRALAAAGLGLEERDAVTLPIQAEAVRRGIRAYLDEAGTPPTAFFADNDELALLAMQAFSDCGVRVPEDVSMVGFDDILYAEMSTPPLTTVHVDKQELGRMAVEILLEQSHRKPVLPTVTRICTRLIRRGSVRAVT